MIQDIHGNIHGTLGQTGNAKCSITHLPKKQYKPRQERVEQYQHDNIGIENYSCFTLVNNIKI